MAVTAIGLLYGADPLSGGQGLFESGLCKVIQSHQWRIVVDLQR